MNNRFDEARKVVTTISTFNKIPFPEETFDKAVTEVENSSKMEQNNNRSYTILDIFRSSVLRKRSLIMMVVWYVLPRISK